MIITRINIDSNEWNQPEDVLIMDDLEVKCLILNDWDFFIEPHSELPDIMLIQFGRGHIAVHEHWLKQKMFEAELMKNPEAFREYKEQQLISKHQILSK